MYKNECIRNTVNTVYPHPPTPWKFGSAHKALCHAKLFLLHLISCIFLSADVYLDVKSIILSLSIYLVTEVICDNKSFWHLFDAKARVAFLAYFSEIVLLSSLEQTCTIILKWNSKQKKNLAFSCLQGKCSKQFHSRLGI